MNVVLTFILTVVGVNELCECGSYQCTSHGIIYETYGFIVCARCVHVHICSDDLSECEKFVYFSLFLVSCNR